MNLTVMDLGGRDSSHIRSTMWEGIKSPYHCYMFIILLHFSHIPGWFKSLLPASALTVEERAWNAYPYTKTVFSCPFVEKFSLEIETYYTPDGGHRENVFNLTVF